MIMAAVRLKGEESEKDRRQGRSISGDKAIPGVEIGVSIRILWLIVALLVFYTLIPLYWLVIAATKSNRALLDTFGLVPSGRFQLLANVGEVFRLQGGLFARWFANTLFYAGTTAVIGTLISAMAGYVLGCFRFSGRAVVFGSILGSLMVPTTALAVPTYVLFSRVALLNNPLGVILPGLASPFGVYLMYVFARGSVPIELLDAARVDGGGEARIFGTIALPLMRPGLVTVGLLTFVGAWNSYFLPLLILNREKLFPLTVGLVLWAGRAHSGGGGEILYTAVVAGSLLSITPLIVAFITLQRYWRSGLLAGSVAG